jgi:DNA-directed RNA polymerase specialized sigma24 family protein
MNFPSTQWSLLAEATLHGEESAAEALAVFCERYRPPVVKFIRGRGFDGHDAEDVAHDFFLHLMEKSTLRRADSARGRFRSFLIGALVRFLGDERDRRTAGKRGGKTTTLPLEDEGADAELVSMPPPHDALFDREWALSLLALALRQTEADYTNEGRAAAWPTLRLFVPGGVQPPTYEEGAARLGVSLGAFKSEIHRLRKRFRLRLREVVAGTVSAPPDIDMEIAYLGRVLQGDAPSPAETKPPG